MLRLFHRGEVHLTGVDPVRLINKNKTQTLKPPDLNVIKQFVLCLNVPLEQAGVKQIEDYIDYLHQKRMQPASINLYLAIIRMFYNYLKYEKSVFSGL